MILPDLLKKNFDVLNFLFHSHYVTYFLVIEEFFPFFKFFPSMYFLLFPLFLLLLLFFLGPYHSLIH